MSQTKHQLYRHFDKNGNLLYVGVSLSAIHRLGQHRKHAHWYHSICRVEIETFETRPDALNAERSAIQNDSPLYNVHHKFLPKQRQLTRWERTRQELDHSTVNVKACYTISDAAQTLSLSIGAVKRLMDEGVIGHIKVPGRKNRAYITGWQMIEFLEYLESECAFIKVKA